jgi:hypothetical protein
MLLLLIAGLLGTVATFVMVLPAGVLTALLAGVAGGAVGIMLAGAGLFLRSRVKPRVARRIQQWRHRSHAGSLSDRSRARPATTSSFFPSPTAFEKTLTKGPVHRHASELIVAMVGCCRGRGVV